MLVHLQHLISGRQGDSGRWCLRLSSASCLPSTRYEIHLLFRVGHGSGPSTGLVRLGRIWLGRVGSSPVSTIT